MTAALLVLPLLTLTAGPVGGLEAVVLRPPGEIGRFDYPGLLVAPGEPASITVDLDLAQEIAGYVVELVGPDEPDARYRVEWQFETSMSIQDEGPHLDLLDWKHHTSPWATLERDSEGRMVLPQLTEAEATRFPEVTMAELLDAIEAQGRPKWTTVAVQAPAPGWPPTYVGVSAYRLRVQVDGGGGHWSTLVAIEFRFPMGC